MFYVEHGIASGIGSAKTGDTYWHVVTKTPYAWQLKNVASILWHLPASYLKCRSVTAPNSKGQVALASIRGSFCSYGAQRPLRALGVRLSRGPICRMSPNTIIAFDG